MTVVICRHCATERARAERAEAERDKLRAALHLRRERLPRNPVGRVQILQWEIFRDDLRTCGIDPATLEEGQ